jgi:hypothetical protein
MTRAKFKIASVTKTASFNEGKFHYEVKGYPVTGNTDENKKFYESTPSGELRLGGLNEEVANQFEPGKEYYLTIEKAE